MNKKAQAALAVMTGLITSGSMKISLEDFERLDLEDESIGIPLIEIMNLRKHKPVEEFDVRVDRETIFGNPYKMKSEADRSKVCDLYTLYFYKRLQKDDEFAQEVEKLFDLLFKHKRLRLFCWCAPKRCHAETIRDLLYAVYYIYLERTTGHGN